MRARVGPMPQPTSGHDGGPGRGGDPRMRVQSGMSLEDLKRQTALRLADGENPNDESSDSQVGAGATDQSQTMVHYQQHPRHPSGHQYPREPQYHAAGPQNAPKYQQRGAPPYGYGGAPATYSSESRNYTDSQLGVGGGAGRGGNAPQFASPHASYRQPLQQQYSTPRMPRHNAALKDRGSTENSVGSDPSGGSGGSAAYAYHRGNRSAVKGHRTGSYGENLDRAGAKHHPMEMRSPDGRHTPVRDVAEGHVLFNTPNQRREVPSTPYTEPSRRSRRHQNVSPNFSQARSPDHHTGHHATGGGGGYYNRNQPSHNQNAHSKLPHGLTVQELKEMTRARLAAEADILPTESSDQSVHSAGTHGSSKGSDKYLSGRGSNLGQSNDSIRHNQGLGPPAFGQGQRPRHPSPIFGTAGGPIPEQFAGEPPPIPRRVSPAFGLSSSQTKSLGETWEMGSAASRDLHTPAEASFHTGNSNSGGSLPFASPMSDSNAMAFNRARCFSAGAGAPSSFDRHQAAYYGNVPLVGDANRQRCATASPPGMSRVHEDRPFLFSTDDKERLAIPPLSEPRMRLHSTGGLNTHGTVRAFNTSVSPPNVGSGSAFMPIGKTDQQLVPPSPPPITSDRSNYDRAVSSSSATSAHGDLPSSMAEAVLESLTSTSGAPIGGFVIGASPFRPTEQERLTANSPYHGSDNASSRASSAFRVDSLLPESSGSMSLFSSGELNKPVSREDSGERLLLGALSWGGAEDETSQSSLGLSHDFGNLLNIGGPALRGRAATEPVWFGGNDPHLVSRQDPEHKEGTKGPPRVSSLVDTKAPPTFNAHQQGRSYDGF